MKFKILSLFYSLKTYNCAHLASYWRISRVLF